MIFMTRTTFRVVVRRTSGPSIPPDRYSPSRPSLMFSRTADLNDPFTSQTLPLGIILGGSIAFSSNPNSQNNTLMNTPLRSSLVVDHEFTLTVPLYWIQCLKENLRYFEGFLNRENLLPRAPSIINNPREMLISYCRVLDVLRALTMIVRLMFFLVKLTPKIISLIPLILVLVSLFTRYQFTW